MNAMQSLDVTEVFAYERYTRRVRAQRFAGYLLIKSSALVNNLNIKLESLMAQGLE